VVDGDDERRRPELARAQSDGPADQAEADDADLLEDERRGGRALAGLDDRELHARGQTDAPHPRRATGSRQMLRPRAGAMRRSSAIKRSNCDGNIDWAPSLSA